jgi:hypothetical protein
MALSARQIQIKTRKNACRRALDKYMNEIIHLAWLKSQATRQAGEIAEAARTAKAYHEILKTELEALSADVQ